MVKWVLREINVVLWKELKWSLYFCMLQYWRDIREINKTSGGQYNWEEDKKRSCLEKFENYIIPVEKRGSCWMEWGAKKQDF